MAKLSEQLSKKGIILQNPGIAPSNNIQQASESSESEQESDKDVSFDIPNKDEDSGASVSTRSSIKSEDTEETEDYNRKMPPSSTPKKKKAPARRSSEEVDIDFSKLSLNGPSVYGTLPFPILSGTWDDYDFVAEKAKRFTLLRMCLPPGAKADSLQLGWIDSKTFKIRLKWPIYMQKVLMMTGLDVVNGKEQYPNHHPVYVSMAKNARSLKDNQGNIWAEGDFKFKTRMEHVYADKLFHPKIDSNGNEGPLLQILFTEKIEDDDENRFTSPAAQAGSSVQFGKQGQKRSLSPNAADGDKSSPNKSRKDNLSPLQWAFRRGYV